MRGRERRQVRRLKRRAHEQDAPPHAGLGSECVPRARSHDGQCRPIHELATQPNISESLARIGRARQVLGRARQPRCRGLSRGRGARKFADGSMTHLTKGLAALIALASGCGSNESRRATDAGLDTSPPGNTTSVPEAATTPEAAPTTSSTVVTPPLYPSQPDTGSSAPMCDGATEVLVAADAHVSAAGDAGVPPADCIAPCVWDVIKNCLPTGSCISETPRFSQTISTTYHTSCWSDGNRWAYSFSAPPSNASTDAVYVGASVCYEVKTGDPLYPGQVEWYDAAGTLIATGFMGTTYCGPAGALPTLSCPEGQCVCDGLTNCPAASEVTGYTADINQPHCAQWKALMTGEACQSGCCPNARPPLPAPL